MNNIKFLKNRQLTTPGHYLGLTARKLDETATKERVALMSCGTFLGDCYIMCEAIDWLLQGGKYEKRIKAAPWFRREIKRDVNAAIIKLRQVISVSRAHSVSESEYMKDVADGMYENVLEHEVVKLRNGFLLMMTPGSFDKYVPDTAPVADLLTIMALLQWVAWHYDSAVAYMKEKCPGVDYDRYYGNARCTQIEALVRDAAMRLIKDHALVELDFAGSPMVANAIRLIDNVMASPEAAERGAADIDKEEYARNWRVANEPLIAMGIKEG